MKTYTHTNIATSRQFLETLKNGPFTWPGFYPLFFITSDGAALSFEAARENAMQVARAIRQESGCGWQVVACDVNWEDETLYCEHTNKKIKSAYGTEND